MREAFREWLQQCGHPANTQNTQVSQATRIERYYGDLDKAYDADQFAAFRKDLTYSKDDERRGAPNPSKIPIDGNLYANLAGYRATLGYFERFRKASANGAGGFVFDLDALEQMKRVFLARYPDFSSLLFPASNGGYWDEERSYKQKIIDRAKELIQRDQISDFDLGTAMLELLRKPPANFVGWRALQLITSASADAQRTIIEALGELVRDPDDLADAAARAATKIHPLMTNVGASGPAYGHVRSIVSTALALAHPESAFAVKTQYVNRLAKQLVGRALFKSEVMAREEYRSTLDFAEALFRIMRDDWRWEPRDLWDVQGFLWVNGDAETGEIAEDVKVGMQVTPKNETGMVGPTNLILYGPPGTGKTFATSARAVELCDGALPDGGRPAIMARYMDLVARRRIAFVTFHQSYSYEEFVEGLRPDTGGNDDAESDDGAVSASIGFALKPHAGIFRRIAELAHENRGSVTGAPKLDPSRQAFKMSLGRSWHEEGSRLFQQAIDGGYVVLGWGGDIDWSPPEYSQFQAIKKRWKQDHPEATGNDPNIAQLYSLRGAMQIGDYVIISDGNKKFRAVGQISGPYEYVPGDMGEYSHRRAVRWLWHSTEGRPRELIYRRGFSQVSAYQLVSSQIDWPALEQIVAGESTVSQGKPEPYVLIIDEINRADVSKVFGELITLIEPDKRLGGDNALTVTLPYSGDSFGVPSNLHIIGTMNTADRSIALLDTALRRRFDFEELLPAPSELGATGAAVGIDLATVLATLNARIEYLFDRDHQIGHAYFLGCRSRADVDRVMRNKVIPLLAEYFYENWEKVRQVLGETTDHGAFVGRSKLLPPKSEDSEFPDEVRWRYRVHGEFATAAYDQLLG